MFFDSDSAVNLRAIPLLSLFKIVDKRRSTKSGRSKFVDVATDQSELDWNPRFRCKLFVIKPKNAAIETLQRLAVIHPDIESSRQETLKTKKCMAAQNDWGWRKGLGEISYLANC